ncbi:MAG: FAD-dependent oxidoreductase [Proteobacteria bacterium]|nr:FAD-dependent oxidoreductase [Pseudomonadota bacterium]
MESKVGAVLVVGGGIAGIQASLDLANSGIKVYLLEKSAAIGGRMAQLDKTFPTNDCAMCIVSPKLVEAGRHLNIEILTNSELLSLSGDPGRFTARLRRHPRYVNTAKCTGCADCVEVCPIGLVNEFNEGLDNRKAIYRPYPQAVPNSFVVTKRGTSPCKATCPAETSAQGYVALIQEGRYEEALEVIKEYNPFPASVGRVCTHPCETQCSRGKLDSPVAICALKRFAADWVYEHGVSREKAVDAGDGITDRPSAKIAVVGSGPAGLSCAHHLVRMGYGVTVFESLPAAGGMMRVGIPAYRLPREVLQREIDAIVAEGVEIRLNTPVRDINSLFAEGYTAVFLAIGAHEPQRLGIEGEDAQGVYHGVPFLQAVSLAAGGGNLPTVGERVVVIGGGNTAVDAARTALRLGAREVAMVYRRSREEMPASSWEIEEAEREGVRLELLTAPVAVDVKDGRVAGIRCQRMELGEPDESGRRRPVPVAGSEFVIAADTMIAAVAQAPEISFLDAGHGLEVSARGTFVVDAKTLTTGRPGIFAGGDAHRGPGILIEAIADGRRGALSIDRYLRGVDLLTAREEVPLPVVDLPDEEIAQIVASGKADSSPRVVIPTVPASERVRDFREVELALTEDEAKREASRCLACGICSECHLCVHVCKAGAIDHQETVCEEEILVGSVILAPGYSLYKPELSPELGYGRYPNVVTSMEYERMLSASGPFGGHVTRPSDHSEPKRIAFLQCVGSRNKDSGYCSSVCCMYAIKEAVITKEHLPAAESAIFYMDIRAQGKDFDLYYERAKKDYGVRFIHSQVSRIAERPKSKNLALVYIDDEGRPREEEFDLAVLAVGMKPAPDALDLAGRLGISLDDYGFCKTDGFAPLNTSRDGVFACGVFQGPKDIPETVVQAGAAAEAASAFLSEVRGTLTKTKEYPPERDVAGQAPRIGVFVCHCGINIGGVVNVPEVKEYARTLPNVEYVDENLYTCSQDTQEKIKKAIEEHRLNRVVVASCSPRTHEPLFQETIREIGLNKYLFEMANIRDQCSWVHMQLPQEATAKSKDLLRMAVAKARLLQPLEEPTLGITKKALVIGGGLAGMKAALGLARQGFASALVEKETELGGNLRHIYHTIEGKDVQELLQSTVREVLSTPEITVFTAAELKSVDGYLGNFRSVISAAGRDEEYEHGVVIVAVGARESQPAEYLYGKESRVVTQKELEERLALHPEESKEYRNVVMIQCVGSRNPDRPNCSRICCSVAVKNALKIKELSPHTAVTVLYRDIRTYGLMESYYKLAREKGIQFIRYAAEAKPELFAVNGDLELKVRDLMIGAETVMAPDLVVLSSAVIPYDNTQLAKMLKIPLTADKFFLEAHMKLRPVDFATDGIFLAGMAHFPKTISETIAQAGAAVARATAAIAKGYVTILPTISFVDQSRCIGCGLCESLCPFNAIRVVETEKGKKSETIAASCKGCGICSASCPQQSVTIRHFTDEEFFAQIEALNEGKSVATIN